MNPWRRIGDQAVLYDGNWRRVLQKNICHAKWAHNAG